MRLGLIGLGVIAPYFIEAIERSPDCELIAVCDLDDAKLATHAAVRRTHRDFAELIASADVDGVVITLPNDLHAEVIAAAVAAGKHVCCEKPLVPSAIEAEALQALADAAGVHLLTAFHRRYNLNVERLRASLPHPGDIASVRLRYNERIEEHTGGERWYLDRARCGGGCIIDNGPNALDTLRSLLGPLELTGATIGDVRAGVEFCAELELAAPDGAVVRVQLDWALPSGEQKDIEIELHDGSILYRDMLDGFPDFKGSLLHEYDGIVADFVRGASRPPSGLPDHGLWAARIIDDAYNMARASERRLRMGSKEPTVGRFRKLLFHSRADRGMELAPWRSRCLRAGELHELVTTLDRPVAAGDAIDRVAFLGFVEIEEAGVVEIGDELLLGDRTVGTVVGFDECHAPNHLNIIVAVDELLAAAELDLAVGQSCAFAETVRELTAIHVHDMADRRAYAI